ncbi:unnamed protein product [Rotaria sp. Silwood1]|nr:unnamed protein product [Rotaria sp. Silwood1]CAF4862925.1 unnamed protein product [Rotaria sp. Silwood1]
MKKLLLCSLLLSIFAINSLNAQWVQQTSGTTALLKSVSAISDQICWVSGAGVVLRTTNAGANWINATGNLAAGFGGSNIYGLDGQTAITAGTVSGNAFVYRTSNGGVNWTQVFTQTGGFINSVQLTGGLNGYMMGDPVGTRWSLWNTNSTGLAWDSTGLNLDGTGEAGWNNGMFITGTRVWFTTNTATGKIYYSTNSGLTFTAQQTGSTAATYGTVWFNGPSIGMASSNGSLFYTTNAGTAWSALANLPGLATANVGGITGKNQTWWVTRNTASTNIYLTRDNGATWISQTCPSGAYSHVNLGRLSTGGSANVWAVGDAGKIIYLSGIVGVEPINSQIPSKYLLEQNYPNPFNPETNINFSLPKSSSVKLNVYNSTGKLITELVNEFKTAGNYSVKFDGADLSSGVYFYTIESEGFRQTKSMMLIK